MYNPKETNEAHEVFQPIRTFLLSAIYPRAGIWFMFIPRCLFFIALSVSMITDLFMYDAYIQPRQDHVGWIVLPTNWVNIMVLVYLMQLLRAAWVSPIEYESPFEPPPVSKSSLILWNLFHTILPLTGTAIVANYTFMMMIDPAYQATLWIACIALTVDTWLGAYMAHLKLGITSSLVLTCLLLYTALVELIGGVHLYAALQWMQDPMGTGYICLRLYLVLWGWSILWYLVLDAKNEWHGIFHYKKEKKQMV
jgi:hypothetical protein